MLEFFGLLFKPEYTFLTYAWAIGCLASIAFGIIGTYVVTRRITYVAGAISHSVLGGIGIALYLQIQIGWYWCQPMGGAVIFALLAAGIMGLVSLYAKQREDTVISAIWASGMAIGLIFISQTPGYIEPMSYLFGNILMVSQSDLKLVIGLDILVIILVLLCYNKFLVVFFDEEFARVKGISVTTYYLILLVLVAFTIVMLLRVVGIVMVIALLTLPAAIANCLVKRLWKVMLVAVVLCMTLVCLGLSLSYKYDLPSGPVIISLAAGVYLVTIGVKMLVRRTL